MLTRTGLAALTLRSTSGFVFMLNCAAIAWRSKRQLTVELCKLDSKLNAADILTNASTPHDVFSDLRRRIMGH